MKFEFDKQTIKDLGIFGDGNSSTSIFSFYNKTKTHGGKQCLMSLMENPLTDLQQIRKRSEAIKYISSIGLDLKIDSRQFELIEAYIRLTIPSLKNNIIDASLQNILYRLRPENNDYYLVISGIQQLMYLIQHTNEFTNQLNNDIPEEMIQLISRMKIFANHLDLASIENIEKIGFRDISRLDVLFRRKYKNELYDFIQTVYLFDAYCSIAKVATENSLAFVDYIEFSSQTTSIRQLRHPLLKNAVPYDIEITELNNLCFLTGPNMAGKSVFSKSLGIAIYVDHLGFPVSAVQMRTSLYNGIMTTINLSDNLNRGYSHFYSEVRRIKEVAVKLKEKNRLFVIFDELFRGTNVKDAFEASLMVIEAFSRIKNSTFYVSTHITEVAEKLHLLPNIDFKYFDSELIDGKPVYNYLLKSGISHERLGLHIVRNEKIVDILNSITGNSNESTIFRCDENTKNR